ncbi:hypothetical protein ULMA_18110 [Patiriisocius marinus]|uniref:Glycosyltransferase 2-like domain-containing protein n=1 Tax=Patiriisocius marinus TaxID=1397112 RepID=A0A5J4J1I8_9FLAO|nr:glycosyltransferase family 2 protein [Patiriisocius marinus]GER59703.1 hypothetical protein ULMA_18110 [Patiriisocius marinus]
MRVPLISIIVPNYNHEVFLEVRLDSIFNQTYKNFEVILLDDASTDNSLFVLNKYKENDKVSHLVINDFNSGSPFKQWKKGIDLAIGDFVWIAESDDYCEPTFLEDLINFNKTKENKLSIIYSQSIDVNSNGVFNSNRVNFTKNFKPNIWENNFSISGNEFIGKYLKVKSVIPNASAVIFKKSLIESNILTEDHLKMKICGDWLFWLKISKNAQVGFLSKDLNFFRYHSNVTRNHDTSDKILLRYKEEKFIRCYLDNYTSVNQFVEIELFYTKWFSHQKFSNIFRPNFYKIRMPGMTCHKFVAKFFTQHNTFSKVRDFLMLKKLKNQI